MRLKDKFSQLKQSRARREEKKQSTSWDGDSVSSKALTEDEATSESDSARAKSLSRKGSRSRIHSDTSEEDESFNEKLDKIKNERFLESDVDLGFADTEEKHHPHESASVNASIIVNNMRIKDEPRTSDEEERMSISFHSNHPVVVNNHDRDSRKKSHKKKQKRQKNSISSEEGIKIEASSSLDYKNKSILCSSTNSNHVDEDSPSSVADIGSASLATPTLSENEERIRQEKKARSKKEKRRDRNSESKVKARRKRFNRQEARDSQRMEDIFGPLSDDVDEPSGNNLFNRLSDSPQENHIGYHSDSDELRSPVLEHERGRRKSEKKRRHQPQDENSVDLAEAGREIEANLLGLPNSPKSAATCTESNDHDVFRFTDDNDSIEPATPSAVPEKFKEKKKKRKKSKEERSRKDCHHHHHHHHHHHEKSNTGLPFLSDNTPPRASSPLIAPKPMSPQLLSTRESMLSPIPKIAPNMPSVPTEHVVSESLADIDSNKSDKKKDKCIPGFGIDIDESIHENAVKSISEPDERDTSMQSMNSREEQEVPESTTPPPQPEDKPRVVISQEETEDAVAALLEETFGETEDYSYEGEEEEAEAETTSVPTQETPAAEDVEETQQAVDSLNASNAEAETDLKPDTPQSEHDLQIDTDTEEDPNFESFEMNQPPKTPDIPSFYKSPLKTPATEVAPVIASLEKPVENPSVVTTTTASIVKPQSSASSVIAHSWKLNEQKARESAQTPQADAVEPSACATEPETCTTPTRRLSSSPTPPSPSGQFKQGVTSPCHMPLISEPSKIGGIGSQPLYQRLPVSPQSPMVSMRQMPARTQNVCSSPSSVSAPSVPSPVSSRTTPPTTSQHQPPSPNGQWNRSPMSPLTPCAAKATTPPVRIPVSVPISAHRSEPSIQHIYSTASSPQPVIQHAPGMRAAAPNYPRGGLPPLTLNIPPRPYLPSVPALPAGSQPPKSTREPSLSGKSVIETIIPSSTNEPSSRVDEPKLSPSILPEPTTKPSTSPKVPSPNQPPTYIPETAKIEIRPSTSSPVFGKTDVCSIKQELTNVQLLATHLPRSSTPSPVIVAHGQSQLVHTSVVHPSINPTVSSPNPLFVKNVIPITPQQMSPTGSLPDKCFIQSASQITGQKSAIIPQNLLLAKSHVPVVSTMSQTIISRVTTSTAPSIPVTGINKLTAMENDTRYIPEQSEIKEKLDQEKIKQMQLTPPHEPSQAVEVKNQEIPNITTDIIKNENVLEQKVELTPEVKIEKQEAYQNENLHVKIEEEKSHEIIKLEPESPPKKEIFEQIKSLNDVKEEELVEGEGEEEPAEDPLKETCSDPLALETVKDEATDSKEDSDYWSAKEVNIESVIKKVDALCDAESNDADEDDRIHERNTESRETSKSEGDNWFESDSMEDETKKKYANMDDQDEGVETCETESIRTRRGRSKTKRGVTNRGGVTTRRGGRNGPVNAAPVVVQKRGGRAGRGGKQHTEKNKLPADVYEFHDDSEEDNAGRPRLILTIKSPAPNVTGPNAQPATPVAAVKEVPPEEFVSPAVNTRKSRRLAEKDGSRSTVDDVIEDVVRGTANKNGAGAPTTRRSTRQNSAPRNVPGQQLVLPTSETRKSPRSTRKAQRRTSECTDVANDEKMKDAPLQLTSELQFKDAITPPINEIEKVEEAKPSSTAAISQKPVSHEPMTLIDPVTGMLIPMRESEEGQYIPVSTASGQIIQNTLRTNAEAKTNVTTTSALAEIGKSKSSEPASLESAKPEPKVETTTPCKPAHTVALTTTAQQTQNNGVITKPQSPAVQTSVNLTMQSSTMPIAVSVPSITTVVPANVISTQTLSTCSAPTKPTSLKAHVLNASKLVNQVQHPIVVTKAAVPNVPTPPVVQNMAKQPTPPLQGLHLHVPTARVVSPSLSPHPKPIPAQTAVINAVNGKPGQPMSPVLNTTGGAPNPKQHLLQAAKQQQLQQQTPTIVNMQHPKIPLNAHTGPIAPTPIQRIHAAPQPPPIKGINGQPHPINPKAHLLQAVVPSIVAGTVASPPTQSHLAAPQAVVTGVPCTRTPAPKTVTKYRYINSVTVL